VALETLGIWDIEEGQPCTTKLVPLLAESWRYTDPTTLEVKLRQGVKFQNVPPVNGRELTAQDVLFSHRRMFDVGIQKSLGENIASMEAVDRYTIRIKTKQPAPLLPSELFAWRESVVLAKEAGGKDGKYDKRENIIGTGPFILAEYTTGVGHVAKRNPDYWVKGRPYLDELRLPIMRDQATRVAALQVGKLDFVEEIDASEREQLIGRKANVRFVDCEAGSSYAVFFRNDLPPFKDVRLRRALSMAFDREGVVKGVFRGNGYVIGVAGATTAGSLNPQEFPPEVRKYLAYNPSEAKKLLAEAGYPNGLDMEVLATLAHGTIWRNMVEALPAILRPGGFNIKLKIVELGGYEEATNSWNYGVAAVLKSSVRPPIEVEVLNDYHSREIADRNRSAVKDPELDRLIDRMSATVDPQERLKIVHQIQTRMVDQAYFIQFPTFFDTFGLSRRLQGNLRINALIAGTTGYNRGLVFRDVWVAD
jgi:peptide/nickel transport system substrate-binding protein